MQLARHLSSLALALAVGAPASDAVRVVQVERGVAGRRPVPVHSSSAGRAAATSHAHGASSSTVALHAITSGWIVSSEGDGVGGIQLTAWTPDGALAGVSFSAHDGSFDLVTPAVGPLLLSVPGTGVSVPFVPGESLAIVVP